MNTLVGLIARTTRAASAQAKLGCKKILPQSAAKHGSWAAIDAAPRPFWRRFATPSWCRESSSDLLRGASVTELFADTIPCELLDEIPRH